MTFEAIDSQHPEARYCLQRYFQELRERFEDGFTDPPADEPATVFLLGRIDGQPVACGVIREQPDGTAYLKRMWVDPTRRGQGLGRELLQALEAHALARGLTRIQLETNRVLPEAIRLYTRAGYREVPPFNDEPYAHHWFEKDTSCSLPPETPGI